MHQLFECCLCFVLCVNTTRLCQCVGVCRCLDDRISMQSGSSQASLTINNTDSTDTGCYSVQLVNVHGSERMYSSVTVEGTSQRLCILFPFASISLHFLTHNSARINSARFCFERNEHKLCFNKMNSCQS